jgi:hypothetical protein
LPKKILLDPISLNSLDENQAFKAILDTHFHRSRFVHHYNYLYLKIKYPYRIFKKNYIEQLQYFKVLNSNYKLIKKYNFFINSKIQFNKRYYKIILESKNILIRLILNKLSLFEKPFIKNFYKKNIFYKKFYYTKIEFSELCIIRDDYDALYLIERHQRLFKIKHF